jgi:hypothetical protein
VKCLECGTFNTRILATRSAADGMSAATFTDSSPSRRTRSNSMIKTLSSLLLRIRMRKEAAFRFDVASRFNRRHTYTGGTPVGGRWMCPTCMDIHCCTSTSKFTGRQFPACCEHAAGPRLDRQHAAPLS